MDKYSNLLNLLNRNFGSNSHTVERNTVAPIKLLFVSADYGEMDKYFEIDVTYFDKTKFVCDVVYIKNDDIDKTVEKAKDYDCVINLCDGYLGNNDDIPNINFIQVLEQNGIPYTGSNSRVYCLTKHDLAQIGTAPKSCKVYDGNIPFPLFVKANNLGCSEGIDEGSVVHNEEELQTQVAKIRNVTEDIIIQEYIAGNEYTALVFRNRYGEIVCLGPMQLQFTNPKVKYLTNEVKKSDDYEYKYNFDVLDKDKMQKICIDTYDKLDLNAYVRMDMRNTFVIDVNPYPEILGNIEYEEMSDALLTKFYSHDEFLIDMLYDAAKKHTCKI